MGFFIIISSFTIHYFILQNISWIIYISLNLIYLNISITYIKLLLYSIKYMHNYCNQKKYMHNYHLINHNSTIVELFLANKTVVFLAKYRTWNKNILYKSIFLFNLLSLQSKLIMLTTLWLNLFLGYIISKGTIRYIYVWQLINAYIIELLSCVPVTMIWVQYSPKIYACFKSIFHWVSADIMIRINNSICKVFTFGQRQSCQGNSSILCHVYMPLICHIVTLIRRMMKQKTTKSILQCNKTKSYIHIMFIQQPK